MEENRIPKRVLYMNWGTTRLRGIPRNRLQDVVREDRRIVGGEGWQEKVLTNKTQECINLPSNKYFHISASCIACIVDCMK